MTTVMLADVKVGGKSAISMKLRMKSDEPVPALSFSIAFPAGTLKFEGAVLTKEAKGFNLEMNRKGEADGSVGFMLDSGAALDVRKITTIATLRFSVLRKGAWNCPVAFGDKPAPRSVSGSKNQLLETDWVDGDVISF